jgi:hypothetical protein
MRNSLLKIVTLVAFGVILGGCGAATESLTKGAAFPKMYEEQPRSLLILPPMNESTDAEAKDYYMTTAETPYTMMGYYTFPVEMVSEIMKQEGVYDTELLYSLPADKFRDYFGADAVLFTTIKKWNLSYIVVASSLTVSIEAKIVSTKTSEVLWEHAGSVVVDLGGGNNSGGGIESLIINAIFTAVNSAAADYVTYAHQANQRLIATLPAGPYSEAYMADQDVVIGYKKTEQQ